MTTRNHTAFFFLRVLKFFEKEIPERNLELIVKLAEDFLDKNVALLLLPDALRMYGPHQLFHFTKHPFTGEVSWVKFKSNPKKLKKVEYISCLQKEIPACVIDELSDLIIFIKKNNKWRYTAYATHLYQDYDFDKWIRERVDVSERFRNVYTYIKPRKVVSGTKLRKDIALLDEILFKEISKVIHDKYGVVLNKEWYENHVYKNLMREYTEDMAKNTWSFIEIPSTSQITDIPEFVDLAEIVNKVEEFTNNTVLFL